MERKKVHLVLGSGGARGLAHIGVIEVLEEHGYEILSITGCSVGAVVGGIYAAGFQEAYKEWMLKLTKTMLFRIMDFTFSKQGFLKGERIITTLQGVTGHHAIENLKIPFTAVATDMVQNREVHYTSGDMYKAIRASIAIPGVFTPVMENGQYLVDGGVLNPLPLNLVRKKADEQVIAVNLNGAANSLTACATEQETENALWKWVKQVMQENRKEQKETLPVTEYSLRELLFTTYHMTQDRLTALMLQAYPPDVLIEIPRNSCSTFEFYRAKDLIELGRDACHRVLSARVAA